MMGWLIALVLPSVVFAGLWRLGHMPRTTFEMIGAALAFGLAGYAWQGSPSLAGKPTPPSVERVQPDTAFAVLRPIFMERFGPAAQILDSADAMHRQGLEPYGIALLRGGIAKMPRNSDLWVGLGNALVQHSDGLVSPAARYAYQRAQMLSPQHPAPPFFLGLAYAEAGQLPEAEAVWTRLLIDSPPGAPWRAPLEHQIALLKEARVALGR
jgi:cytochrome c-type biogenesis protein CcmH